MDFTCLSSASISENGVPILGYLASVLLGFMDYLVLSYFLPFLHSMELGRLDALCFDL